MLIVAGANKPPGRFPGLPALHSTFLWLPTLMLNDAGRIHQGIYINRYTYQSCWNVFLRGSAGGGEQPTDLSEFQRFLICNDV